MADLVIETGFDYDGQAGSELLDANVVYTLNQMDILPEYKGYKELLSFSNTPIINPNQEYGARYANGGLDVKEERGNKKERGINFGPKKGTYQQTYSNKFNITEELTEWIRASNNIEGAPQGIQAEFVDIQEQIKDLVHGYDITLADVMSRVYAEGYDVTASEGPGSATAKGVALYGTQTLLDGTTFDNLIATAVDYSDITTGVAVLQEALDVHKSIKLDNGRKMRQPGSMGYNLVVPRIRETFWRKVMNNGMTQSGLGENSAQENQFLFDNNIVNLKVMDNLGDFNEETQAIIGGADADNMFFVTNPKYLEQEKALRCYELYSPKVKTWMNNDTDEIFTSLKCSFGADHYYAEYGMVAGKTAV
ncbi:MAG: hypothetical protein GY827_10795 [Cytophagales bacterium]|nr:hypothetical protein [Cytophagales bacterium]